MESVAVTVGILGVAMVLLAYALLATGRLAAADARYQWLNIVGTLGIVVSLLYQWNLPSFIAQIAWISIGIWALIRNRKPRGGGA